VICLKKVLRRLLTPILERQLAYNVANARLASYLCEQVEVSKHQQMDAVQTLQVELARQAETVQRLQGELARQVEAVQVLHAELARQLQGFEPRMAKRFVERTQQEIDLQELQKNWNEFAQIDPLWAIITWPEKKGNKWDVEEFFSLGVHDIEAVMNHASSLGIIRQRRRALDFGCGVGRITQALARHFEEVCGIDIAPAMIELAKQYNRYGEKCRYYVNNTDDLTLFTDSSFDFIFTIITLQHIKPPYTKNYIREFLRILAPQGLLIFQLPSEPIQPGRPVYDSTVESYEFRYDQHSSPQPYMEMYGIHRQEVTRFLEENGGEILAVLEDQSSGPNWVSFKYFVTKP